MGAGDLGFSTANVAWGKHGMAAQAGRTGGGDCWAQPSGLYDPDQQGHGVMMAIHTVGAMHLVI